MVLLSNIEMKQILISAGHSDKDPGAVGNGLREADVVTEFRDMVAHYLAEAGVAFTRDGAKGENLSLSQAIRMIPSRGIAVEFHLNAASSKDATGVETLSSNQKKDFCRGLCELISLRLGIRNRGAKDEGSGQHSRLAFVQAGGVIVELFFLTNEQDLSKYKVRKHELALEVAKYLQKAVQ